MAFLRTATGEVAYRNYRINSMNFTKCPFTGFERSICSLSFLQDCIEEYSIKKTNEFVAFCDAFHGDMKDLHWIIEQNYFRWQ